VLSDAFGADSLGGMRRLTPGGPVEATLDRELDRMEAIFHGAYGVISSELGIEARSAVDGRDLDADIAAFRKWMSEVQADEDLAADCRLMVPVFYDIQRRKTKVWVVLGWTDRPVEFSFATPPDVQVFDKDGRRLASSEFRVKFDDARRSVWYPVTAEIYVNRILSREEMRKVCDEHKRRSAILTALQQ
jgi:hypothetical protein